jgi:hypothetical protein
MSETVRISSVPPEKISMNYAALRESGMELIRQWAEDSWTDHNVHDPGITLLEAFSYAITELGLRLQLDIADLLRSGDVHRTADLEPAHRVLPSGPVTVTDLRKLLLDHPLVSDAQIFLPADSEVPFYENLIGDPPLTYTPGTSRVRPSGLYEVLIEFMDRELNSNTYSFTVASGGQNYRIDLALPFWDEDDAAPFRQGAVASNIAMLPDGGQVWRPLQEPQSYFGEIKVDHGAPSPSVLWVLLQITDVLEQPDTVTPGILNAARTLLESTAADKPLALFSKRARNGVVAVRQIQGYLSGWRNLGEELVRIGVARIQEIVLRARIEVTGGIDLEKLLAEIFMDVDGMLSPSVRFQSLAEVRAGDEGNVEEIYNGPLLHHGFIDVKSLQTVRSSVLYISDILRLIMRRRSGAGVDVVAQENLVGRNIIAVTDLTLSNFVNNRPIATETQDCLRLVEIERYWPRLSLAKSRLIAVSNDSEVAYDLNRVESFFNKLQQQEQAKTFTNDLSPVWPVALGELLPIEDYVPIQNELPSIYGVGETPLPDSASPERRAAVRQLQGYLLLFEQILADHTVQLGHINRFFSADPDEDITYFTRPLFELAGIAALLKRFPPGDGDNWKTFVATPDNPVTQALQSAAESHEQRLDRRNRMLDHLLARQGEDMVAFGQELHRWAQRELLEGNIPSDQLLSRIAERRNAANARLIRAKAALLRDAPELNAFRLLAVSNSFESRSDLLRIESVGIDPEDNTVLYGWTLVLDGQERLRSVPDASKIKSPADAAFYGEEALFFAGRGALYLSVNAGAGQHRYQLKDGVDVNALLIAESPQTFATKAAADEAARKTAAGFASLRPEYALAPMERRIAHQTGIRSQVRRRLLAPLDALFEIFSETGTGGVIAKGWRLWELPGHTGKVLLRSTSSLKAPTETEAVALAKESIRRALRYGIDEWNYTLPDAGTAFTFELKDPAGQPLARSNTSWTTRLEAEQRITETVDHLYIHYSAEGFYLVEHLLLRPRKKPQQPIDPGDPFLLLPAAANRRERDPYSQRISLIFPSGNARDFSVPRATAKITPVTPDRFRDPEFRSHAELMVQQACPAHLMPTIYWVDQQTPGSPDSPASFNRFEERYLAWLDTVLTPGTPAAALDKARIELVETLNAIANDPL